MYNKTKGVGWQKRRYKLNSFICIFCPAVAALLLYEKTTKKKFDYKYSIAIYALFVLFINIISTVACQKVFHAIPSESELSATPLFAIKYAVVALVIGVVIAFISGWLMKNVKISIVVKKEKRNHAKAKKRS